MLGKTCSKCGINTVSCLCEPAKDFYVRKLGPKKSIALATTPENAKAAKEYCEKHGVKNPYSANGDCTFTDNAHERAVHELLGYYDRSGRYSSSRKGEAQRKYGFQPITEH